MARGKDKAPETDPAPPAVEPAPALQPEIVVDEIPDDAVQFKAEPATLGRPRPKRGHVFARALVPVMHRGRHIEAGYEGEIDEDTALARPDLFEML